MSLRDLQLRARAWFAPSKEGRDERGTAFVVTACLAAASIPARRAAHVDPATTLRQE